MGLHPDANPRISIIIPTYNRCARVIEAVNSVLEQTLRSFELIVVDDGSTDATCARLRAHCAAYPDIATQIIPLAHSGMAGHVRNCGVAAARGTLIAFLDDDDVWIPGKLEHQVELHNGVNAPQISHTREIWRRGNRIISQAGQRHTRAGDIFADALRKCIIGPSTTMLTRTLFLQLGGFRSDLPIAEDYELWLRITARHRVAWLDHALTIKRGGHADQLSALQSAGEQTIEYWRIRALQSLVDGDYFRADQMLLARAELARKCHIYAVGRRKRGHDAEADRWDRAATGYSQPARANVSATAQTAAASLRSARAPSDTAVKPLA